MTIQHESKDPSAADVIQRQRLAPQPNIFIALILLFACSFGLRALTALLIEIPKFYAWTKAHHPEYHAAFFTLQMLIYPAMAICLLRRFPAALILPRPVGAPPFTRKQTIVLIIAASALVHQLSITARAFVKIAGYDLPVEVLRAIHDGVWASLAGGTSLAHVIFISYSSIVGPIVEEIAFTGFLLNRLSRRFHLFIAMPLTAELFAVYHLLGLNAHLAIEQLPRLFFHSLVHQSLRLAFGRLDLAIMFHILMNILILSPKWALTSLAFQ